MFLELLAVGIYGAGAGYDAEQTEIGLRKGLALERNTFLVGSKPTAIRLFLRDILYLIIMLLVGFYVHPALMVGAAIAGGFKHLVGGLRWHTLNTGGTLKPLETAWRKFLGF